MSSTAHIEALIQQYGEKGLRFLFLFKILKTEVKKELIVKGKNVDNGIIDDVCGEAAKDLLTNSEHTPTKEEIEEIVLRLKKKLEE